MSTIISRIFHLTFSRSIVVFANIILFAIYARTYTVQDYATIRETFLPYEILVPFLSLGIPTTIYYLLPRRTDTFKIIIHSSVLMYISLTVCIFLVMIQGGTFLSVFFRNSEINQTQIWLLIYTIFQIPINLIVPIFIYQKKTKFIGIFTTIQSSVLLLVSGLAAYIDESYVYQIVIKSLLTIPSLIVLILVAIKYLQNESVNWKFKRSARNILKVSIPFGLASLLGTFTAQIDKLVISNLGTSEDFAIYVNGSFELPIIGILTGSISLVLLTEFTTLINKKLFQKAAILFRDSASKTALIIFPTMIYFMYNSKNVIVLLFGDSYIASEVPFFMYLFLLPIRIVVFGSILIALGKGNLILRRSALEVLFTCLLSILFFIFFGVFGIPLASIVVNYLWSVPFNIVTISKELGVRPLYLFDFKKLLTIMLVSVAVMPTMLVSNCFESRLSAVVFSAIIYFCFVLLFYKYLKLMEEVKFTDIIKG